MAPAPMEDGADEQSQLVGMAEIAELAGLSRQAITNLRARDESFPAPIAELRSGPVFREADVQTYLHNRGRTTRQRVGRPGYKRTGKFDPLSPLSLARSVERALLEEPLIPLSLMDPFEGAGVYCIYYSGSCKPYKAIATTPPQVPIYVGAARSPRPRVGGLLSPADRPFLYNRLRHHAQTLEQVEGLHVADFSCRFLVVDDMWAPLAEELLIHHFRPVWNVVVDGFGNHNPGNARLGVARSPWDELHRGRPWATKQKPAHRAVDKILEAIEAHLNTSQEPDLASIPYGDDERRGAEELW